MASPLARANDWLAARRRVVLATLLILASLVRVISYLELCDTSVFVTHRHEQMDTCFFDEWGKRIADGDVVSPEPFHPMHIWHQQVAWQHFEHGRFADGRTMTELGKDEEVRAVRGLWDHWYGGARFHQEPVYPYLIGLIYAVFGSDDELTRPNAVYLLQMLFGILSVALLYGVTRRSFNDLVAVAAACMMIGWAPVVAYEVSLLRVSLITVAGLALLYVTQRLADDASRPGRWRWAGYGAIIGLTTLIKSSFLLLSIGFLAGLLWQVRKERRLVWQRGGIVAAAFFVCMLPLIVRNVYVGVSPIAMTSVAAVTFAVSNAPEAVPSLGWSPMHYAGTIDWVMSTSGGALLETVTVTLGLHTVASYLSQLGWKIETLWHWFETPNNTSVYWVYRNAWILSLLRQLVSVLWIMPLSLIGIAFAVWQRRQIAMWIWFLLCAIAPLLVFYVLSRFRVPLVVGLMPLAAYGLLELVDHALRRRWKPAVIGGSVALVLGLTMNRDLAFEYKGYLMHRMEIAAGPYYMGFLDGYAPRMEVAVARGDVEACAEIFTSFLRLAPDSIEREPTHQGESEVMECFAVIYDQAVELMREAGDPGLVEQYSGRARRLRESRTRFDAAEAAGGKAVGENSPGPRRR